TSVRHAGYRWRGGASRQPLMAVLLYRLGRFAYERRRLVAVAWVALLIAAAIAAFALKAGTNDAFSVPGTESTRRLTLLDQRFPGTGGAVARIVFAAPAGQTLTNRDTRLNAPTGAPARKVAQRTGDTEELRAPPH